MFFFGTHHAFEDGDLPGTLRDYVVTDCLSALHQRLLGFGSPDVRWPPDTGQQTWGATNRVVTGTGGLLVPGFNWIAGDEQRHSNAHHSKPGWFLHVWNRLGTFYAGLFSSAVRLFCLVVQETFCCLYRLTGRRYRDPGRSSNQSHEVGGWWSIFKRRKKTSELICSWWFIGATGMCYVVSDRGS